jgi:hypothetical protein
MFKEDCLSLPVEALSNEFPHPRRDRACLSQGGHSDSQTYDDCSAQEVSS